MKTQDERRGRDVQMVSATDLGRHVFCPQATRMAARGTRQSQIAFKRMLEGNKAHEIWQSGEGRSPEWDHTKTIILIIVVILILIGLHLAAQG